MTPTLQVQGAPEGVQGVLEEAGYLVYAPTLPYHEPGTQWSPSQGAVSAQNYVDYLKQVPDGAFCPVFPNQTSLPARHYSQRYHYYMSRPDGMPTKEKEASM